MIRKRTYCLIVGLLAISMLSSILLTAAAQTILSSGNSETWQPPQNFVNPVTLKIQEFQSQGLSDNQILAKLTELGMGWDPQTGATWLGTLLTPEAAANMPAPIPVQASSSEDTGVQQSASPLDWSESLSSMRTSAYSWTGVGANIVSGDMTVSSGQTQDSYVCMQLGDLDGATSWVETVVTHDLGQDYKWYTYDPKDGWVYYMDKNTDTSASDNYVIMLSGTKNSNGWEYDVWINYNWVRSGYLSMLWCQAGFQKEVYSTTGAFTNDASAAVFYPMWVHNANGWSDWTNAMTTKWSSTYPVQESYSMGAQSYDWQTGVQN